MTKYLFLYYGGKSGSSPKEVDKSMAEWTDWFKSMGRRLVEMGAPTMPGKTVSSAGYKDTGAAGMVTGYSVVTAGSMEEAVTMAKGVPDMDEGVKVAIYPLVDMAGPKK